MNSTQLWMSIYRNYLINFCIMLTSKSTVNLTLCIQFNIWIISVKHSSIWWDGEFMNILSLPVTILLAWIWSCLPYHQGHHIKKKSENISNLTGWRVYSEHTSTPFIKENLIFNYFILRIKTVTLAKSV